MVKGGPGPLLIFTKHRVYTQSGDCRLLTYILSSALAGEGGGARPPPFSLLPSRTKLQCTLYVPAERADTPPDRISSLPYKCSVIFTLRCVHRTPRTFITPDLIYLALMTTGTITFKGIVSRDLHII
jgi:hypothetical protein